MYWNELNGVKFIEGNVNIKVITHLKNNTGGHLKNLDDLKLKLSKTIKSMGGNAIINFKYGQKSSFWKSFISIDNIQWYVEGDVVFLSKEEFNELIQK